MRRKDPVLQVAMLIHRQLVRHAQSTPKHLQDAFEHVLDRQQMVQGTWQLIMKARKRGWHAAGRRMTERLFHQARFLQERLNELLGLEEYTDAAPDLPTVRDIVCELRQLSQEFESVELDPRNQVIAAETSSIELEGLTLGPFTIELHIDRLGRRFDSGCFDLVAIEPYPASSDDAVTHPHVRDKSLCAGEATVPLSHALRQGRITDAFSIVQSVLRTYNAGSPYVQLSDWDGTSCPECGGSVASDDLYRCTACDNDFCESCISLCEICNESTCTSCLERDPVTRRYCCPSCRSICNKCGRVVENDEFDDDNGLCPACSLQEQGEDTPTEETNDEQTNQPQPAEPAAA